MLHLPQRGGECRDVLFHTQSIRWLRSFHCILLYWNCLLWDDSAPVIPTSSFTSTIFPIRSEGIPKQ